MIYLIIYSKKKKKTLKMRKNIKIKVSHEMHQWDGKYILKILRDQKQSKRNPES